MQLQVINIHFLLIEHMLATSSTLPIEMLMAAESRQQSFKKMHQPLLSINTVSSDGLPVPTQAGIRWQADFTLDQVEQSDIIYIPGLWRNPRPIIRKHPEILFWLKKHYERGALISAVGTGCCFLAEAGLLDGKAATTHWHYFDQFQQDYPKVQLKRQHFITQAANLYCTASINSLADLTVHFIQRMFGKPTANHVERHFSHEIRQSYESNVYFESAETRHPDEDILQIQIWMQDNYAKSINLEQLAMRFGMSVRTLNRRFKAAIGKTPINYLQQIRVNTAKDLLKTTNLSLTEIADRVGYQDAAYLSDLFKRFLATSPSAYRETVRGKLFST